MVAWHSILYEVNIVSKMLQEAEVAIRQTMHQLKAVKDFPINYHSCKRLAHDLTDAKEMDDELEIKTSFPTRVQMKEKK